MGFENNHMLALVFGILGNIISVCVYFAPLPTFHQIYKKKSTEGFQSLPYLVALVSATLWLYYALLLDNATLLLTINTFGCIVEFVYIFVYIFYATKKARDLTIKIFVSMNMGLFAIIVFLTYYLAKGQLRVKILGWICAALSVGVFVAPLGIVMRVIRTKSIEFMPFTLSVFLTMSAAVWFFYGFLKNDYYIATPNILGFFFGVLQMVLYGIYKNIDKVKNEKLPERVIHIVACNTSEVHPVDVQPNGHHENVVVDGEV